MTIGTVWAIGNALLIGLNAYLIFYGPLPWVSAVGVAIGLWGLVFNRLD